MVVGGGGGVSRLAMACENGDNVSDVVHRFITPVGRCRH